MNNNIQNNDNTTEKEEKEKKQKTVIIILVIVVAILLIALLLSFLLNKGKTTEVIKYKSVLPSIRSEMQNDSNIKRALDNNYKQITCSDFNDVDRCNNLMNKLGLTDYELFYTKSIKDNIENFKEDDKVYAYLQGHSDSDEEVIILHDKTKDTVEYLSYDTTSPNPDNTNGRPPAEITCLETKYNGTEQMIATCEGGIVSDNAKQIEAGDQLITCMGDPMHSDSSKKCKMEKYDGKLTMTVTKVTIEYTGEPVVADVESLIEVPIEIQYFSDSKCVSEAEPISVGKYYITASITATENYDSASLECREAIEITKKHDVVYIRPKAGVYNGSPIPANEATSESGTPVSITYFRGENCSGATLSGPPSELGNYSVSATSQGNEDYLPGTICVKHTIAINNTASEGRCNDLEFTGADQTLASGGRHVTYFNNTGRAAGDYEVVAQADDMYAFDDGETVKILNCTIKQVELLATPGTCNNLEYNGEEQDLACGATHAVYVSNKGINAGDYEVIVRAQDGYIFENGETSTTLNCSINKKHIVVTADSQTKTYDGKELTSNACKSDGIVKNDSLTCTMTPDSKITDVGNVFNEIQSVVIKTIFGNISNNYDVQLVSGKLTIIPGEDKIKMAAVTSTYDGNNKTAAFSSTSGSAINVTYYSDSACENAIDGEPLNAGIYYATASTPPSVNYPSVSFPCTKAVTILQKQDVVTLAPKTAIYTGDPVPANKAESDSKTTIMYSYYTSSDCSGTSIVGEPVDVGSYSVKAVSDGDQNYISGTMCVAHRIVKGTPVITLLPKEVDYDGTAVETNTATAALPNGNAVTLDFTYTYYSNDTCTRGETNEAPTNAGQYYVKAVSNATSNLVAAESACTSIKIKGILVTAIATAEDREYNAGSGATCTVTLVGVKEGDDITATVGSASFDSVTAGENKTVYCRNITLHGSNSSNYSLESSTVQTTATIFPKTVTVTAGTSSRPYNGGVLTDSSCQISGQIIGDIVGCTMSSDSQIVDAGTVENVIIGVTISRNGNDVTYDYNPIIVNGLLTVTRIDDEIDVNPVFGEFDGTPKNAEFISQSGLTVTPTYYVDSDCTTTTDTTNANEVGGAPYKKGVYYATAVTAGNNNYRPTSLECSFAVTVGVKNDTVTMDDIITTYTGSAITASGATCESGTNITYRYYRTTDCTGNAIAAPINAGFYSIKATSEGNDNYRSGNTCVLLTINKGVPTVTLLPKEALFDGSPVVANSATATKPNGSNARLSFSYKYYTDDACTENETNDAPTNAGQYYAMATSVEEANLLSASSECVSHKINSLECSAGYTNNEAGGCNVITYNITYTVDEETVNSPLNPSTYTVESESIVLAEPVKLGYKFAGWTGTNGDTPELNVTIPQGSIGDRSYTANWYPKAEVSCINPDYSGEAQAIAVCTGGTLSENGTQVNVGDQEVSCTGDATHSNSESAVCSVQKVDAEITCTQEVSGTRASDLITSLVEEADETSIEPITLAGPTDGSACTYTLAYDGTSDNNLRYVGENPCNYVTLEGQTYRIIGVMNNVIDGKRNSTSRLKLIATSPLPPSGLYSYDVSDDYVYEGKGANEWSRSDVMTALNGPYYDGGEATLYRETTDPIEVDLSEINLNSTNLVSSAIWHTAEINTDFIAEESYIYELYAKERSSTVVTMPADGHLRRTEWLGKVGAIYASDVQFATKGGESITRAECLNSQANDWSLSPKTQCYENNWFNDYAYIWLINPFDDGFKCSYINNYGGVASQDCNSLGNPYPTVYLDYDVLITSGEGTEKHPYELHIKPKYNGSEQTIATCENGTLSGNSVQTNVGSYTITCTGDSNHNDVTKVCSIEQAVCDSGYENSDNGGCNPITYTITYETGDAVNSPLNPTTYTVESPEIEVISPVKDGYRFAGWTGSNGEEPENPLRIPHGSFGDKTYQVNWYPQAEIECLNPSYTGEIQPIAVCEDGSVSAEASQSEVGEYTVTCEGDDRHSDAPPKVCSLEKADSVITCSDEESLPTSVQTITSLVEDQEANANGIITLPAPTDGSECTYTFAYDNTTDNNLRYVGPNPCNYIKVAGQDFRIIGVMNNVRDSSGNAKSRLKLVSKDPIGEYSFDTMLENPDDESITGYNNWTKSDLNRELNNIYFRSLSGRCYIGPYNAYKPCDFSTSGLDGSNLVGTVMWDLGGTPINSSSYANRASIHYVSERGSETSGDRAIRWTGRVGLFYPSDYAFATSGGSETDRNTCLSVKTNYDNWGQNYPDCGNNSWINKSNYGFRDAYTLTPSLNDIYELEVNDKYIKTEVYSDSEMNNVSSTRAVYPTIFLNANATIISGTGTENDPYTLSMNSEYSGDVQIIAKCSGGTLSNEKQTFMGEYEVLCTGDQNHKNSTKTCKIYPQNCEDGYVLDSNGKCQIQNYTITYNLDGGTIINEKPTYTKFEDAFYLPFPVKEGMIFEGWTGSNGETPQKQVRIPSGSTGDREYTANYSEISEDSFVYVRYDINGGEGSTPPMKTYLYNSTINLYGGSIGSSGSGNGSILVAHTPNVNDSGDASGSYSNNMDSTQTITLGRTQDVVIDVWYNTESCCDWVTVYAGSGSNPSTNNDTTISASTGNISGKLGGYASSYTSNYKTWLHSSFAISTDAVKFHFRSDYSVTNNGFYATISTSTSKFDRNGYEFIGWNTKADGTGTHYEPGQEITITSNLDLYAEWKSYKIKYVLNGGHIRNGAPTTYNPATGITIGEEFQPVRDGYVFAGWVGSNGLNRQMTVTFPGGTKGDLELIAVWAEAFNITYNLNGAEYNDNPTVYTNYTNDFYLYEPYREGYVFAGWTGSNGTTPQTNVYIRQGSRGDKEFTANWEKEYILAYDLDGGYISSGYNPTRYSYLSSDFSLRPPTKSGYTFIGWTGSNGDTPEMTIDIPQGSRGDRLYVANWEPTAYTIEYDLDGGINNPSNRTEYTMLTETFELAAPTKDGYRFIGWTGSNGNNPQTNIQISQGSSGNRTYKANYENLNPITVSFDLNGGIGITPQPISNLRSDQIFIAKTQARFVAHSPNVTDQGTVNGVYGNSIDTTSTLSFGSTFKVSIDIWYDTESGCDWVAIYKGANSSPSYNNDNSISTSTGNFTGKLQGRNSNITSNYTTWLHSSYITETDTLKFHFRTDGSVQYNGYYAIITYDSKPTKEGYAFLGWNTEPDGSGLHYDDGALIIPTTDMTLYAEWGYEITYELDGGVINNAPTGYASYSDTITIPRPTKVGFDFVGWTGSNGDTPEIDVTIPSGSEGNKIYRAHFFNACNGELFCDLLVRNSNDDEPIKYNGMVTDSVGNTVEASNVFYFKGPFNSSEPLPNNNVLLGDTCWQIYRTTETQGIKLLYNGKADSNNQCGTGRPSHGYVNKSSRYTIYLYGYNYYYGTDYVVDGSSFRLAGDIRTYTWNSTNANAMKGLYTCQSTSPTGTCSTLYKIDGYSSSSYAYAYQVYRLNYNFAIYTTFSNTYLPVAVSYMYNDSYGSTSSRGSSNSLAYNTTYNTSYYFGDSFEVRNGYYVLKGNVDTAANLGDVSGKYTLLSSSATSSGNTLYKVHTKTGTNTMYYNSYSSGTLPDSPSQKIYFSSDIDCNTNSCTLTGDVRSMYRYEWFRLYETIPVGFYTCGNNSTNCSSPYQIYSRSNQYYYYYNVINHKFANTFSYNPSTNTYTLGDDAINMTDMYDNYSDIKTHRYTCFTTTGTCTGTIYYVYSISSNYVYYIPLTKGRTLGDAMYEMGIYTDDFDVEAYEQKFGKYEFNKYNSKMKDALDEFYVNNLSQYTDLLEDNVYCNKKEASSLGMWDENNVEFNTGTTYFIDYYNNTDLSCNRINDQYSTSNEDAHLTYSIGLITFPEFSLIGMNNGSTYSSAYAYTSSSSWSMSPYYLSGTSPYLRGGTSNTSLYASSTYYARPVITLKPGIKYTSGNGNYATPYVIDTTIE